MDGRKQRMKLHLKMGERVLNNYNLERKSPDWHSSFSDEQAGGRAKSSGWSGWYS